MSNKNVLFIEDNGFQLAKIFDAASVRYENQDKDQAIEGWLIKIFEQHKNIEKIVIPVKLGKDDVDNTGLRVGIHIRLTEKLNTNRFVPLIFLSETSKESLIADQISSRREKTATILNTPNCKVVPFDVDTIKEALANFKKPLDEKRFKIEGLPKLIIETHRDRGHQLANEWGCIRLANLAGFALSQIVSADLYFKYRLVSMQAEVDSQPIIPRNLLRKDMNVLLIDDNAKKGWEEVTKKVLNKYIVDSSYKVNIATIESVEDFQKQKNDIEKFDIVFLDLRLSKDEDNPSRGIKIEDFSGSKLLKEIKGVNRGIQTIILTASNKAWNMKYLLDIGADGYYIKESPEIIVTNDFSKESFSNFIDSVKKCLTRQYLKSFFSSHKAIISKVERLITSTTNNQFKEMLEEIQKYLEVSFEMVYGASNESDETKGKDLFGYAYLSLFRVVESINKYFVDNSGVATFPNYCFDENNLINKPILNQTFIKGNNVSKLFEFGALAWISIDKLILNSNSFLKQIFWAVKRRNKFIHADILTLGELKTECDKIYTHKGYEELLNILEKIIISPNF